MGLDRHSSFIYFASFTESPGAYVVPYSNMSRNIPNTLSDLNARKDALECQMLIYATLRVIEQFMFIIVYYSIDIR